MKVKIKSWEAMEKEFGLDECGHIECEATFTKEMEKCIPKDRIIEVKNFYNGQLYEWMVKENSLYWFITDDMIEEIIEETTMKELKVGEYCWVWNGSGSIKHKRIYLGTFNGLILAVSKLYEEAYKNGEGFETSCWYHAEPIEEPVYYYRWKKKSEFGTILTSSPITDSHAERNCFKEKGWVKIEESKTTFEDFKG